MGAIAVHVIVPYFADVANDHFFNYTLSAVHPLTFSLVLSKLLV